MNTLDCYRTLKMCFGEGREPGVRPDQYGHWSVVGRAYIQDEDFVRDRLLSAALKWLEDDGWCIQLSSRGVILGDGFEGDGQDTLSRLCDAVSKLPEEARDGTV